jgi:hypothetical protein
LNLEAVNEFFIVSPYLWWAAFAATFIAFLLAIPSKFYNARTLKAVMSLPKGFLLMFLSLFKLKGANKKFIHTQHGTQNN